MSKPRKGSAWWHGDHWDCQITLPNGKRSKVMHLGPEVETEARAREVALRRTQLGDEEALDVVSRRGATGADAPPGETFEAWATRWCSAREEHGLTSVDDDRGRLRKWILPLWRDKPVAGITRTDVEALVEDLDARVRAEELSWRTARNVWALVTKALADSCKSKVRALRVRDTNPAADVAGPDRGVHKSKAWLFPAEFVALMACSDIPVMWRRMYVLAAYLYLRAAELRGLDWPDLDLASGVVLIHRTEDDDGNIESTKGMRSRRFVVEAAILPLLRVMHKAAGGTGRVIPHMPVEKHLAPMLRRDLERAGITRADLVTGDKTRKRLRFHDLRASGLTWMAIRGDDPLKIKQRAGHATFSTTEGYIREAEAVRDGFGEVFPPLPDELESHGESHESVGANGHVYVTAKDSAVGEAGFESSSKRRKRGVSAVKREVKTVSATATLDAKSATSGAPCDSMRLQPTPRSALADALAGHVAALLAAGDMGGAKVAADALARLVGSAGAGPVVDLGAERRKRGR